MDSTFNFRKEDILDIHKVGDTIHLNGKRFKLTKVVGGGRNVEVVRWYWWDVLIERMLKKAGCP